MAYTFAGTVEAVLIAPHCTDIVAVRQHTVEVTLEGFAGDRHAGLTMASGGRTPHYPRGTEIRNSRQVSLVSVEELAHAAADLGVPEISPEALGANLLISGIPALSQLPPGTRLFFQRDAVLVVEGENGPCTAAGAEVQKCFPEVPDITAQFPKAALHRRGIVAWVERAGQIAVGDEVHAEVQRQVLYDPAT